MGKKRKEKDRDRIDPSQDNTSSPPLASFLSPSPPPAKKRKTSASSNNATSSTSLPEADQPAEKTEIKPVENLTDSKSDEKSERAKLALLLSALSNSQQDQYEIYRRSTFPKSTIRRIMQSICGAPVPQNTVIAMAGITKVYVGEIVEEACRAREGMGESSEGPLLPKHVREAVRRLRRARKIPNSRYKQVLALK